MYHPADDDVNKEFIELTNTSVFTIPLDDWRIRNAVDIIIPPGTSLDQGEAIVLVAFDPTDSVLTDAFRDAYQIDENVRLLGPWGADELGEPDTLSNGGERVTLLAPVVDLEETFYVETDQVDYNDRAPWPLAADGHGGSIERTAVSAFGNDPASWVGQVPTPGNQPLDLSGVPNLTLGAAIGATIGSDGLTLVGASDVDVYRFTPATTGSHQLDAVAIGEMPVDPFLRVFDASGNEIAFNDNLNESTTDSRVTVDLEMGQEYFVVVSGSSETAQDYNPFTGEGLSVGSTGTYTLDVQQLAPDLPTSWHNSDLPEDVTGDGVVVPFDALTIINELNANGSRELPAPTSESGPPPFLDVVPDGFLAPFDALTVINYLNNPLADGEAEPVEVSAPASPKLQGRIASALFFADYHGLSSLMDQDDN